MAETSLTEKKTLREKVKLLVSSNFPFSHSVFKRLVLQTRKNTGLFGKGFEDVTFFYVPEKKKEQSIKKSVKGTQIYYLKNGSRTLYKLNHETIHTGNHNDLVYKMYNNAALQIKRCKDISKHKISRIVHQNLYCGYSLESSCRDNSNEYPTI